MQPKKQTQPSKQQEIENKEFTESEMQKKETTSFSELYCSPKITNKMKHIYAQFFNTKRMQFRPNTQGGQSKWIFKTELKVVSEPIPQDQSEQIDKSTILSKIRANIKLSERELQRQTQRSKNNKKVLQQLMIVLESQKKKRIELKKKMVHIYLKKMRLNFLTNKLNETEQCINEFNKQFESKSLNIEYLQTSIKEKYDTILKLQSHRKMQMQKIDEKSKEIALRTEQIKANNQKIRQISIKKLPNQKQLVSCMFSIGIINQQLYVIQLKKHLKKQISLSELQVKRIKKQPKMQQCTLLKASFSKEFNECISKRKICIDCGNSQIVIFKVFTIIYMHCKSLHLKNIASIMSKTSYFSENFKELYDFPQFQKYMINLVQRFKGNEYVLGMSQDPINCIENTLTIVTDQPQFNYLNWILKAFNFIAEGIYYIRIGQNKTFISLISKRKLSELQKTQQYGGSLRIKFKGLTKTSVYD